MKLKTLEESLLEAQGGEIDTSMDIAYLKIFINDRILQ